MLELQEEDRPDRIAMQVHLLLLQQAQIPRGPLVRLRLWGDFQEEAGEWESLIAGCEGQEDMKQRREHYNN